MSSSVAYDNRVYLSGVLARRSSSVAAPKHAAPELADVSVAKFAHNWHEGDSHIEGGLQSSVLA
jgi:hypothetical protein